MVAINPTVNADEPLMEDIEESLEDFYGDEEFISIATGTRKAIHMAPAIATVITAKEIQQMGANSIYDVLETVTGIHIYPSNLDRMKPNFSIRGIHTAENPQTLVLVNGERTTFEYNGSRWQQFNLGLNLIERIEVIRGPGSAIYGADAFSGVINIITKGVHSVTEQEAGVKFGSFDTKSIWLNIVNSDDEFKYSFNAQWTDTKGDDSRIVTTDAMHAIGLASISNAPGPLDTKYESIDIHGQLAYKDFYLSAWYMNNEGGTGAGAAQALSFNDIEKTQSLSLKAGYKWQPSEHLKLEGYLLYQTHDDDTYFEIFPAGMALPRSFDEQGIPNGFTVFTEGVIGRPIVHEENISGNLIANYNGITNHNIRAEIGYRYTEGKPKEFKNFGPGIQNGTEDFIDATLTNVRGTPFIFMFDQDRDLHFITLQDEWHLASDWELTAGIRYDNYSDFGSTFNPRLALVWQTKHNMTTKFLYGEAFRAPSFQELYAINNPIVLGTPNLEPEKIKTYEVAIDYRLNFDWQLMLNLFSYDSEELIGYVANDDGSSSAQNAGKQQGKGLEFETHWKPNDDIHFKLGYAWQDSEDNQNIDIADAPGRMLDINVNWQLTEQLNLHMDTRWIMDRKRLPTDPRKDIANYYWTNLAFNYQVMDNLTTTLSIRNLFDKKVYEPSDGQISGDFPLEERGMWLTFAYTM